MKKLVATLGSVVLGLGGVGNSVYAQVDNSSYYDVPWEEQFSEENGWTLTPDKVTHSKFYSIARKFSKDLLEECECVLNCYACRMIRGPLNRAVVVDCYVAPSDSEYKGFFGFGKSTYSVLINRENIEKLQKYFPQFINALQDYMNLTNSKENYSVEAKKYVDIMNNCLKNFPTNTRNIFTNALVRHGVNLSQ